MLDYLDSDVAYLIGMIIGRGMITEKEGRWIVDIEFPFVIPRLEGYDQFSSFVTSVLTYAFPRIKSLLGEAVSISVVPERMVKLTINLPSSHIAVRNFKQLLEGRMDYSRFIVPEVIRNASVEIAREFVRGFADVAGNIRRANRDRLVLHRVFLDVLNSNWTLPVQLCDLLQNKLQVPVHHILWGHPNLRDPQAKEHSPAWREHQIRIYAHDFLKVGFYIAHKQAILEALARENEENERERRSNFCKGYRQFRSKAAHPAENDKRLPEFLRGKHFDAYWQICAKCGCDLAVKAVKKLKR
ncbi:MAG: hypothetical protein ACK4I8_10055, partial [Armatimonadota bacterium]